MSWFKRKSSAPPVRQQTQIVVIHSTAMTADQFRASPDLVTYAAKLFQSTEFQTLFAVLRNESPSSYGLPMGASHDDHIAHSYKGEGYQMALNTIELLTRPKGDATFVEPTYGAEPPTTLEDQKLPDKPA